MALPMLVGGAECGPSNPLQGLSKRFDHDRGIQQDFFHSRKGVSKDVFRTQPEIVLRDQDASRFFAGAVPSPLASQLAADAAIYDISAMQAALPAHAPQQLKPVASWATDFVQQSAPLLNSNVPLEADARRAPAAAVSDIPSWTPSLTNFRMNSLPVFLPQASQLDRSVMDIQNISWEKEFHAQELQLALEVSVAQPIQEESAKLQSSKEADDLARTAGLLLDNLKHEENPKFKKSQFMGLMKQLRDREVVVDGNSIVQNDGTVSVADVKGKGRAISPSAGQLVSTRAPVFSSNIQRERYTEKESQQFSNQDQSIEEDPNLAYFQRENEDYVNYWNAKRVLPAATNKDAMFWDKLQRDWDELEGTAVEIKAVENYQFQPNNPYVLGDSSETRHHRMHTSRSIGSESVLELEAAVQRNATDPRAWYELGVKQQENEREHKALQALQRAVHLDPTYLSAWLALAVSHANNNNRQGTFDAISCWVGQNGKHKSAVEKFNALHPADFQDTLSQRCSRLIQCLISLVTSDTTGEVDPDIQIALAILLNTNEEYDKAQDCFRTALAVRPDDWLLYNRVGATMANSGGAEHALEYYYRALELNPGYIRARFNLGISYINLRRYEEAAKHILDALVLQESDGFTDDIGSNKRGVASTLLWDTLKTTSWHLQRPDLAALCDNRNLDAFRNNFK